MHQMQRHVTIATSLQLCVLALGPAVDTTLRLRRRSIRSIRLNFYDPAEIRGS
ncbi:MAG: hypothetical protein QOE55_6028 [Acidobacteriaceae bacterium]|nr:hypothetical protein [Acidobacteriaceae bacterium]